MTIFLIELKNIGFFIVFSFILSLVLLGAVYILSYTTKIDIEKSSAYECGFQPFSESQYPFEVQFALIAILFLLFDVEILYLYPVGTSIVNMQTVELFFIVIFFVVLGAGLLYELLKKATKIM